VVSTGYIHQLDTGVVQMEFVKSSHSQHAVDDVRVVETELDEIFAPELVTGFFTESQGSMKREVVQ